MQTSVVIAGYARSPFHFANKGELTKLRPDEMAAQVVRGLLDKTGVDPADIEDLIVGCAFPEGEQGLNVARLIGFLSDLPLSVAGTTVNRFCGSSMQAIHMAAGAIQKDPGRAFICPGVESMTRVPQGGFNPLLHPGLAERYPEAYVSMGETAENLAEKYDISRARQDELALVSHSRAAAARAAGKFAGEIVAVRHGNHTVEADGCSRPDTSAEALAGLKPAMGTRDMDSTPPHRNASPAPMAMAPAAMWIACMDEPQNRLTVAPAVVCGSPARKPTRRAIFSPCSPSG